MNNYWFPVPRRGPVEAWCRAEIRRICMRTPKAHGNSRRSKDARAREAAKRTANVRATAGAAFSDLEARAAHNRALSPPRHHPPPSQSVMLQEACEVKAGNANLTIL